MVRDFLIFVLALLLVPCAWAVENTAALKAAQAYLDGLTTFQAKFTETQQPSGLVQAGTFSLQRPNKFLWQYSQPTNQKVVATGSRLFFVEGGNEGQVTQLPMGYGLAGVLTQPSLKLTNKKLGLKGVKETKTAYILTFMPNEQSADSPNLNLPSATVTMEIAKKPRQLVRITTTTPLGESTEVRFSQITQGQKLAAKLFNYIPPQEEDFLK
ncbi:MAG: outer membrane lipoprotein carrier protein LolA [Alphaproteobacteria bacterium]